MHYKYIFVILTYKSIRDLPDCVGSIRANVKNSRIIIVNSRYDEETSAAFREYADTNGCDFLDVPNRGYGYGNNRGIEFARQNYSFDWLIISNPDVVVRSFEEDCLDMNRGKVVAPLTETLSGKAQNPYWFIKNPPAEWLIYKGYKLKNRFLLYSGIAANKVIRECALRVFLRSGADVIPVYAAHGSFCIYPYEVLARFDELFDEHMFLFSEEAYLAHLFEKNNIEIVLTKGIKVLHKEDGSIGVAAIDGKSEAAKSVVYYYEKMVGKRHIE